MNGLRERKRLTIKIGHPLCTHAPVGTKCRGKKSFPFVHLPISGEGERTVSGRGCCRRVSFLRSTTRSTLRKLCNHGVTSTSSEAHLDEPLREMYIGTGARINYANTRIASRDRNSYLAVSVPPLRGIAVGFAKVIAAERNSTSQRFFPRAIPQARNLHSIVCACRFFQRVAEQISLLFFTCHAFTRRHCTTTLESLMYS